MISAVNLLFSTGLRFPYPLSNAGSGAVGWRMEACLSLIFFFFFFRVLFGFYLSMDNLFKRHVGLLEWWGLLV